MGVGKYLTETRYLISKKAATEGSVFAAAGDERARGTQYGQAALCVRSAVRSVPVSGSLCKHLCDFKEAPQHLTQPGV